jgi:uncharacterized protein YjeT (DUF2065 family)
MLTLAIPVLISLIWLAAGAAMIAAPAWWRQWVVRALVDPFSRFLLLQSAALAGVLLLLAASEPPRDWFWIAIGAVAAIKALALLGLPDASRDRLMNWWQRWPDRSLRASGLLAVALAVLLAVHGFSRG